MKEKPAENHYNDPRPTVEGVSHLSYILPAGRRGRGSGQELRNHVKTNTVKPVLVATSIKRATCIKQACGQFLKKEHTLKCTYIKHASVLSKYNFYPLGACLIHVGLYCVHPLFRIPYG